MKRLLPALLGASLLLGACGSTTGSSVTPTSSSDLLSFSSAGLGQAYVGESYTGVLAPSGGIGPYSVRLVSGKLPAGLSFTGGGSGTVSGTPTAAGNASFTLEVSDANLSVRTQAFNLQVVELPPLDFSLSLPQGELRGATRLPLKVVGPRGVRAARYTWVLPGNLKVTGIKAEGTLASGRPLLFWKQSAGKLTLDFGFRLAPKNGAQVAMISVVPIKGAVTILPVSSGSNSFVLAQDAAGKLLREVKPGGTTPATNTPAASPTAPGTPDTPPPASDVPATQTPDAVPAPDTSATPPDPSTSPPPATSPGPSGDQNADPNGVSTSPSGDTIQPPAAPDNNPGGSGSGSSGGAP